MLFLPLLISSTWETVSSLSPYTDLAFGFGRELRGYYIVKLSSDLPSDFVSMFFGFSPFDYNFENMFFKLDPNEELFFSDIFYFKQKYKIQLNL